MVRMSTQGLVVAAALGWLATTAAGDATTAPSCPQTSSPTSWSGSNLDVSTTKTGTTYNSGGADIELNRAGAVFNTKQMTTTSDMVYAAVGDFNNDGWPDFVGASEGGSGYLDVFTNQTWLNENCTNSTCTAYSGAAPNWSDPTVVVTPKFTTSTSTPGLVHLHAVAFNGRYALAAADFNGDGWDDVLEIQSPASGYQMTTMNLYINKASNLASGLPQFNTAYQPLTGLSSYLG
jgi:hypothetical protein